MNIETRLRKMESRIIKEDSEFCGCFQKYWESAVEQMYEDKSDIETEGNQPPDFEKGFCEKCRKPFSNNDIELSANLVKLYGDQQ